MTVFFGNTLRPINEISANCLVDPVPAPPPDPITDLRISEEPRFAETYQVGEPPRTVIVNLNFTWTQPTLTFGGLRNYDVWFERHTLSPDESPGSIPRTPVSVNYTTIYCTCGMRTILHVVVPRCAECRY